MLSLEVRRALSIACPSVTGESSWQVAVSICTSLSKAVWNELVGDDETVRVWEISTKKCVHVLEDPGRRWGQITCLTWLGNWGNDDLKPIAFGTGRGLMVIYRRPRINVSVA